METPDQKPKSEGASPAPKRIYSTGEAAEVCKVSQQTIIRCFDAGRIGGFRVPGSKFRRIPREELLRFMRANAIPTDVLDGLGPVGRVLIVSEQAGVADAWSVAVGDAAQVRTASDAFEAGRLLERLPPHLLVLAGPVQGLDEPRLRERLEGSGIEVLTLDAGLDAVEAAVAIRAILDARAGLDAQPGLDASAGAAADDTESARRG